MKSTLIKDTTKEERIALIRQWVPADEAMEDCDIDLWDMYRDYINGEKEIAEINASFVEEQDRTTAWRRWFFRTVIYGSNWTFWCDMMKERVRCDGNIIRLG